MGARRSTASSLAAALAGICHCTSTAVFANHPVLVEGESDFDGDGLLGVAEDTDNDTDQVFGTINAALGAANRAANQNGHVIIVTSGRFLETVVITAENGDVSLQAALGVEAEIEAVRAGDPGSADRQGAPGIVVDAPGDARVVIRNIVSRNWTEGIVVRGSSRVLLDGVRVEFNRDFNIHVTDSADVVIVNSQVAAAGFRNGAGVDNTPNPGVGIAFEGSSRGVIADTTVFGSFGADISNRTGNRGAVVLQGDVVFDDPSPVFRHGPSFGRGVGRGRGPAR